MLVNLREYMSGGVRSPMFNNTFYFYFEGSAYQITVCSRNKECRFRQHEVSLYCVLDVIFIMKIQFQFLLCSAILPPLQSLTLV